MRWRRWVLLTHRWMGLSSSIVLIVLGVTGAVLVWPSQNLLHRIAGPVHERLALERIGLGNVGWWIVVSATACAVLLELGGVVLWWKRKTLRVRFDRSVAVTLDDLHHLVGAIGFVTMFVLAVSGIGMSTIGGKTPRLREFVFILHTSKELPGVVKVLYLLTTIGFAVQGLTGVVVWWRGRAPRRSTSEVRSVNAAGPAPGLR